MQMETQDFESMENQGVGGGTGGFIVGWYRPHPGRALWSVYALGVSLLLVGMMLVGLVFFSVHRFDEVTRLLLGLVGGFGVIAGPVVTVFGFRALLFDDVYLLLRSDALVLQDRRALTVLPWSSINAISGEERPPRLRIACDEREDVFFGGRFLEYSQGEMAAHLWSMRRKALMGLLRPPKAS